MPLSELYQTAKRELDSPEEKNPTSSTDMSFGHENDFVELVWENGKVMMHGQSSRARKSPSRNSLPSYIPKPRDKSVGSGSNTKSGKFGTMDSALNEFFMSVPSGGMNLIHDDDMVPWLDYPIAESLQNEYCSDYLSEISGVTANEFSTQNTYVSIDKRSSSNQSIRDSHTVSVHSGVSLEQGNLSKASSAGLGDPAEPRSSNNRVYSLSSEQGQTSFPSRTSKVSDTSVHYVTSGNLIQLPTPPGCFPVVRTQKQDSVPSSSNSGFMNFSHFSQPAALVKSNLQNIASMSIKGSGSSSRNPNESTLLNSSSCSRKEKSLDCQPNMMLSKVDSNPSVAKPMDEDVAAKQSNDSDQENAFENDKNPNEILGESATKVLVDGEKSIEPLVVSSVCSGNSVEIISDDPTHNLKRKQRDTEESEGHSEDADEDSVGVKRAARTRGGAGSKRSRAAEVHNLSERRRRDRINEKMRALQELIPNCNKVDKASMLDEAIEHLKTLQLQVQIMSMGAGIYMQPIMLTTGMQQMHAAHMAHFSPMAGMGMGMQANFGMGIPNKNGGSSGSPMIQVPPMQGAHFLGPPISGPTVQGIPGPNLPLFGLPCHGIPMSIPCAPFIPPSGRPHTKSSMGLIACTAVTPTENLDSAPASNLQAMQMNQTTQCQATNKEFEQSALVQNDAQASDAIDNAAITRTDEKDI